MSEQLKPPRTFIPNIDTLAYLHACGLLHLLHLVHLVHTSLTSLPQVEASRLATEGVITEQRLQTISLSITSARAQANDLMSSLDRDAPFPYVALCGLLVNINVFIMSTWKGVEWSVWFQSFGGPKLVEQPKFWVDMLVLVSWNVSYKCLYDITYVRLSLFN